MLREISFLSSTGPFPAFLARFPGVPMVQPDAKAFCNTRQMLRPTDTIHASSFDLLMRMDRMDDERQARESKEGET